MTEQNRLLAPQFTPGSDEWYVNRLFGIAPRVDAAEQNSDAAGFIASTAPVSGELLSARDAWDASGRGGNALLEGNYGEAASQYGDMLLGLLGAVPGAGIVARGTKRGAAWMNRNLPAGVNRLVDAMMPADPKNTMFSGGGPTRSRIHGPSDSPARPKSTAEHKVYRGQIEDYPSPNYNAPAFFSDNPEIANIYSSAMKSPDEYNQMLHSQAHRDMLRRDGLSEEQIDAQIEDSLRRYRPNTTVGWADTSNFKSVENIDNAKELDRQIEIAKSEGYSGLIARNMQDVGGRQNQYVTWTPGTVRSAISRKQLYNVAPFLAAPAAAYGLSGDDQ